MKMHYIIRRIAGAFVLASLALGYWVSPWWYLFTHWVRRRMARNTKRRLKFASRGI